MAALFVFLAADMLLTIFVNVDIDGDGAGAVIHTDSRYAHAVRAIALLTCTHTNHVPGGAPRGSFCCLASEATWGSVTSAYSHNGHWVLGVADDVPLQSHLVLEKASRVLLPGPGLVRCSSGRRKSCAL